MIDSWIFFLNNKTPTTFHRRAGMTLQQIQPASLVLYTSMLVFTLAAIFYQSAIWGTDSKNVRNFAIFGVLPLAILSAFRHIVFHGQMDGVQQSSFFEREAGGANLIVAVAIMTVIWMRSASANIYAPVFAGYASYFAVAFFAKIAEGNFGLVTVMTASMIYVLAQSAVSAASDPRTN